MLSGGIDSPVAGYLARVLAKYNNTEVKIHVIGFTKIQEEIIKNIPKNYLITMMRRMMYKISALICGSINAHAIINGESIGQVASQTLKSMQVINEAVKMPVIRPVACLDKLEIIDISKKIDTYDISILPYEDCCTVFVPKHPIINPNLEHCLEMEANFNYEELITEIINNLMVIDITSKESEYEDIL